MKGNVGRLHQAFLNVMNNACQSINEKGDLKVETNLLNGRLQIKITDTGSGISNENLKRIFDRFFTTKSPGEGTGLGLSITQNIIKEHNGNLKISSQLGEGTVVVIELPISVK